MEAEPGLAPRMIAMLVKPGLLPILSSSRMASLCPGTHSSAQQPFFQHLRGTSYSNGHMGYGGDQSKALLQRAIVLGISIQRLQAGFRLLRLLHWGAPFWSLFMCTYTCTHGHAGAYIGTLTCTCKYTCEHASCLAVPSCSPLLLMHTHTDTHTHVYTHMQMQ